MIIVPLVVGIATFLALRAYRRQSISAIPACLIFFVALLVGMVLSFLFVFFFSYMLSGDGALAIIAAPISGAILSIPIALILVTCLIVFAPKKSDSKPPTQ